MTVRVTRKRLGLAALMGGLTTVAFLTGGWLSRPEPAANGTVYQQARLFEDVLASIRRHYVDSISETDLYFRATKGIVEHLNDPYSALLVSDRYRRYTEQLSGTWDGLGVQLDLRSGRVVVAAVTPGSPAARAGLAAGDQLVAIDSMPTKGLNVGQATEALRGDAGTSVLLQLRRPGASGDHVRRLVRAPVHVAATSGVLLDGGIGVVALSGMTSASAAEFRATVDSLTALGMRAMVLDLRYNPGGIVTQGVEIADLLLDPGLLIGTQAGRTGDETTRYAARGAQPWPSLRVAVLVNGGTASAAEILTGALQDHDRAVVVGTPTYGKGAVQSTVPLGRDIALKLTTGRWLTPSGRAIQRPVQLPRDDEMRRAAGVQSPPADEQAPERWFLTTTGRAVRDASGIDPDVAVAPRSDDAGARRLARAIGGDLSPFHAAVERYAAELYPAATITSSAAVAPWMLDSLRAHLARDGHEVTDGAWDAAAEFAARELGDELAGLLFGDAEVRRRVIARDEQVQAAVALVRDPARLASLLKPAGSSPE